MVRGRRKTKTAAVTNAGKMKMKQETHEENRLYNSPQRKGSKVEFQGKLSHASVISPSSKITRFFQPQVPTSPLQDTKITPTNPVPVIGRTSPRRHASTMSVLQQANGIINGQNEGKIVHNPHKIEMIPPALSPSSALSQLSLQSKKPQKSRRRLNLLVNQQNEHNTAANNHKLTEYFPVRRSVRKTKRTVLEERQRSLEEAVLANREDGLEVHMFEGKGRGVVATRPFSRGEFVVEYAGELITMEQAKEREQMYAQDQNTGCYMYYFKYHNVQYCVDATSETDRLGRLVNHSRNGNLSTKTVVIGTEPHLVLIAKEDIQPGEEVTYDYGDRSKESLRHHPWLAM